MHNKEDFEKMRSIMESIMDLVKSPDVSVMVTISVNDHKSIMLKGTPMDIITGLCSAQEADEKVRHVVGTAVDAYRKHKEEVSVSPNKNPKEYVN